MRCPECNHKMQQLKKYAVCDYCGFTIELESASKYTKHAPLERVSISPKIEKHASYEHVNYSPKTYIDQRKERSNAIHNKYEHDVQVTFFRTSTILGIVFFLVFLIIVLVKG